jgi:hypothetical protein
MISSVQANFSRMNPSERKRTLLALEFHGPLHHDSRLGNSTQKGITRLPVDTSVARIYFSLCKNRYSDLNLTNESIIYEASRTESDKLIIEPEGKICYVCTRIDHEWYARIGKRIGPPLCIEGKTYYRIHFIDKGV